MRLGDRCFDQAHYAPIATLETTLFCAQHFAPGLIAQKVETCSFMDRIHMTDMNKVFIAGSASSPGVEPKVSQDLPLEMKHVFS